MDKASLKYLPSHEWAAIEGSIVTVGIVAVGGAPHGH